MRRIRVAYPNKSCRSLTLFIFFITTTLTLTAASAQTPLTSAQTTTPASTAFAETTVLTTQDYFQTTHRAIEEAKESIYVAMYLINVEPAPTSQNPASILLEALITAHTRGVRVKVILDDTKFSINYNALKRLRLKKEKPFLEPANSNYMPIHQEFKIIGKLINILRRY